MKSRMLCAVGLVLAFAGAVGVADCLKGETESCCAHAWPGPETRGPCPKDPPGTNCSDLIVTNPTIPFVYVAGEGWKADVNLPPEQECKWQRRFCNSEGYCVNGPIDTSHCQPSELLGPPQECP